jgi:hypothetical protein
MKSRGTGYTNQVHALAAMVGFPLDEAIVQIEAFEAGASSEPAPGKLPEPEPELIDPTIERVIVDVPIALIDNVEFYADKRGVTRDDAIRHALAGFVAASILDEREESS